MSKILRVCVLALVMSCTHSNYVLSTHEDMFAEAAYQIRQYMKADHLDSAIDQIEADWPRAMVFYNGLRQIFGQGTVRSLSQADLEWLLKIRKENLDTVFRHVKELQKEYVDDLLKNYSDSPMRTAIEKVIREYEAERNSFVEINALKSIVQAKLEKIAKMEITNEEAEARYESELAEYNKKIGSDSYFERLKRLVGSEPELHLANVDLLKRAVLVAYNYLLNYLRLGPIDSFDQINPHVAEYDSSYAGKPYSEYYVMDALSAWKESLNKKIQAAKAGRIVADEEKPGRFEASEHKLEESLKDIQAADRQDRELQNQIDLELARQETIKRELDASIARAAALQALKVKAREA